MNAGAAPRAAAPGAEGPATQSAVLFAALAEQVRHRPDAPALSCGNEALSYRGLESRIDAQCAALQAQGLGPGITLGWLGLNSIEQLAALFACARFGARFVPLNWRLSALELQRIATDAGIALLHADSDLSAIAPHELAPLAPAPGHEEGDLLLVYTSGTTGEPKAAVHTQAAMVANLQAAIEAQGLDEHTRTLALLPLFHVGGLCIQTLPTLAAGGCVRLHRRFDAEAWFDDLGAWKPSTCVLVPAVMRVLIEHPRWAGAELSSLDFINSGSSVVPRGLIHAFHARGVPVSQVYGATETGPLSIVLPPREALAQVGRVGWPARGVQVRLVDEAGRDVPEGEPGEVWLRAPNLMRGYHREPAHPSFVDGWFHSGDLARRHGDGAYEVVGRRKDMIVSGGENIYPAEIENLLGCDAEVAECAVVGMPDARWGEVPVLVLVCRPGMPFDETRLRALFAEQLARYKHPSRIVVVNSLPKSALGKVLKAELVARLIQVKPPLPMA